MYESLDQEASEQGTKHIPLSESQSEVESGFLDCNEDDSERETEDKYGMFGNESAKRVWGA